MPKRKPGRPPKLHPNFQKAKRASPAVRKIGACAVPYADIPKGVSEEELTLYQKAPLVAFESAKEAWLKGASVASISDEFGIPIWRLNGWIYGRPIIDPDGNKIENNENWLAEREVAHQKRLKALYKNDKERFERVLSKTVDAIEQGVDKLFNSNVTLTAAEVKNLSTVAKDLHQMTQLEGGKPTKIVENMTVTRDTLLKKLKEVDPFVSYEEEDVTSDPTKPVIQ